MGMDPKNPINVKDIKDLKNSSKDLNNRLNGYKTWDTTRNLGKLESLARQFFVSFFFFFWFSDASCHFFFCSPVSCQFLFLPFFVGNFVSSPVLSMLGFSCGFLMLPLFASLSQFFYNSDFCILFFAFFWLFDLASFFSFLVCPFFWRN